MSRQKPLTISPDIVFLDTTIDPSSTLNITYIRSNQDHITFKLADRTITNLFKLIAYQYTSSDYTHKMPHEFIVYYLPNENYDSSVRETISFTDLTKGMTLSPTTPDKQPYCVIEDNTTYLMSKEERAKYPFFRKAIFEYKKSILTVHKIRIRYPHASVLAAYSLHKIVDTDYYPYKFTIYYFNSTDKKSVHIPYESVHPITLL